MARILTLLAALLTLALSAKAAEAPNCGAPTAIGDGWTIARPDEVGIDGARLCALDKFIAQWPQANVHAVTIARHGKLVMERYFRGADERLGTSLGVVPFAADVKHDVRSVSKSATSLLVGIALSEGKFPLLDSPVLDTFPEYADLRTPEKGRITFRHLLSMSAGLEWDESLGYADPRSNEASLIEAADPFRYLLSRPMQAPPGMVYAYNGGATALLAAALVKSTGRPLKDYARDKLFTPLNVTDFDWDEMGVSHKLGAYGGLRLRPRDMAKLGQLLLADGQWNGTRVLPVGWAAESTKPRITGDGLFFYGYQWWLGRSFVAGRELAWAAAFGLGGQRVYVVPALDLIVTTNTGHYSGPLQSIIPSAILNRLVLPAAKD